MHSYDEAANKAATIKYVDENLRAAFIAGIAWAAEKLVRAARTDSIYDTMPGYPTKMFEEMALKDLRKLIYEFAHAETVEE